MLHRWQTYLRLSADVNMMGSIFHTGFNHRLTEEPVLYTQTTLSFYFKSYLFLLKTNMNDSGRQSGPENLLSILTWQQIQFQLLWAVSQQCRRWLKAPLADSIMCVSLAGSHPGLSPRALALGMLLLAVDPAWDQICFCVLLFLSLICVFMSHSTLCQVWLYLKYFTNKVEVRRI